MKIKKKKGFTLIELLIVVAIIAILAAIAIPQFSSYRIKGYNSSATADLRNGRTAEEAFFSDWQVYASTGTAAVQGDGKAVGSAYFPVAIKAKGINTTSAPSADTTFATGLSQNVSIILSTNPAGAVNFVGITKNTSGDRCFAMDSDVTAVYWINGPTGTALQDGDKLSASDTNLTNDVNGKAGSAGCKAATGQLTYVSL
jgi:type IV pilus assembly protein PilA